MAVNLAALRYFGFSPEQAAHRNVLRDIVAPALGFLFCLAIFFGLQGSTIVIGVVWLVVGFLYVLVKTRGMKAVPMEIDFSES
jgi:hypothetical protein